MQKISAIKAQKHSKQRVNIHLNGEFGFSLDASLAAHLAVGQQLSLEEIREFQNKDEAEKAYHKALYLLSFRPRSEAEVARRLTRYGLAERLINEVVERLRKNELVDDGKFAELWVENRSEFRPRSAYALRIELRQKGISEDIIDDSLADIDDEQLAYTAAIKSWKRFEHLEGDELRKKLSGYLSRRGFHYGVIQTTLQALQSDKYAENESKEVMK